MRTTAPALFVAVVACASAPPAPTPVAPTSPPSASVARVEAGSYSVTLDGRTAEVRVAAFEVQRAPVDLAAWQRLDPDWPAVVDGTPASRDGALVAVSFQDTIRGANLWSRASGRDAAWTEPGPAAERRGLANGWRPPTAAELAVAHAVVPDLAAPDGLWWWTEDLWPEHPTDRVTLSRTNARRRAAENVRYADVGVRLVRDAR